uniref:Uncharacterized protein n=1 Tax=Amphimedon queenslandica TaxID=400682 RepID=A0A1X7T3H6_AMPQE
MKEVDGELDSSTNKLESANTVFATCRSALEKLKDVKKVEKMAALMTDASIDISKWSIICESLKKKRDCFFNGLKFHVDDSPKF